jgi:hypothetical protein
MAASASRVNPSGVLALLLLLGWLLLDWLLLLSWLLEGWGPAGGSCPWALLLLAANLLLWLWKLQGLLTGRPGPPASNLLQ